MLSHPFSKACLQHSQRQVCGFSVMEQVRLCAVWPTENWLGSSLNHMQGWMTVRECCRYALEKGCLVTPARVVLSSIRFFMHAVWDRVQKVAALVFRSVAVLFLSFCIMRCSLVLSFYII